MNRQIHLALIIAFFCNNLARAIPIIKLQSHSGRLPVLLRSRCFPDNCLQTTSTSTAMGNTDASLPPEDGAEDRIMLLPPTYHDREDDGINRSDGVVKLGKILRTSEKTAGTMSKYRKWITKEMALTERHGKSKSIYIQYMLLYIHIYLYTYIWQSWHDI